MNRTNSQMREFIDLLHALREEVISDEQFQRLEEILAEDLRAQQVYINYFLLCSDLITDIRRSGSYDGRLLSDTKLFSQTMDLSISEFDTATWQALARDEITAPTIEIEKLEIKKSPVEMVKIEKAPRVIKRSSVFTVIISIAAMVMLLLMVISTPVRPTVAALTDSMNAEWMNIKNVPVEGDLFRQGDELALTRGIVEITFDDGAVVIVEAPVAFKIESPKSLFMTAGRMHAIVSEYATGFTVNTPSASIIDLGTEFGVSVEGDGLCGLHMFKGKASLIAGVGIQKRISQLVTENQAKSVNSLTGVVKDIALDERGFVRRFNAENGTVWRGQNYSVADMLAGGAGFDFNAQHRVLDIETGRYNRTFISQDRYGIGQYTPVASAPFIDGIFVPDNNGSGLQVSSAGHVFTECPETQAYFRYDIATSIRMPLAPQSFQDNGIAQEELMVRLASQGNVPSRLAGIAGMDTQVNPVRSNMLFHANSGITLDLQNIRSVYPDIQIKTFRSLFGIAEIVRVGGQADVWILVDGQRKYMRQDVTWGEVLEIEVELSQEDRFLTIMVTDSGVNPADPLVKQHAHYDWGLFVNPLLSVE